MRTALVTGGAGFIGSHLSNRLLKDGWKVYIIDNLSTGDINNIPDKANFIFCDLSKDNFINFLPTDIDVVFHFAGQSSGEISFEDPIYDIKTNCLSTVILLDWCRKLNIKRFLYASSVSVYGNKLNVTSETECTIPTAFYGIGKLASEHYMRIYNNYGINTTAFRLFNVYGPGQNMRNMKQGIVSIYLSYIHNKESLIVKGSKDRYRDFIYIDDVIEAIIKSVDNPLTYNEEINIGTGVKTTIDELINKLIKLYGHKNYDIRYAKETPGDIFGIYANIDKAKKLIKWKPKYILDDGLEKLVIWLKSKS